LTNELTQKSLALYSLISDIEKHKNKAFMDDSTREIIPIFSDGAEPFLTDHVKDDNIKQQEKYGKKVKRVNWDTRKGFAVRVQQILAVGDSNHQRQAIRIRTCAETLQFGWVNNELKFKNAFFCQVRNCPMCQWRRSKMWVARFFDAFPRIYNDYPTMRYILLTLTIKNCPITELRNTIKLMNYSWDKLTKYKAFPALGFVRSLEVTRETDTYDKKTKKLIRKGRNDYAHPHFHVILALSPSYFGRNYLTTADWVKLWQKALKCDYEPICDVRIVKPKKVDADSGIQANGQSETVLGLMSAIVEVIKYTVKPSDMVENDAWLLHLVDQLHGTRAISLGGIFRKYLSENDDNLSSESDSEQVNHGGLYFGWRESIHRYRYIPPIKE